MLILTRYARITLHPVSTKERGLPYTVARVGNSTRSETRQSFTLFFHENSNGSTLRVVSRSFSAKTPTALYSRPFHALLPQKVQRLYTLGNRHFLTRQRQKRHKRKLRTVRMNAPRSKQRRAYYVQLAKRYDTSYSYVAT